MTKDAYRVYFAQCREYVKLKPIVIELGYSYPNFMKFLNRSDDWAMSLDKLDTLKNAVCDRLVGLIA